MPFNIPGYATVAYEIFEQLGDKLPRAVIVPAGQGGLLLGLARGFNALRIAYHLNSNSPKMIGVQVRGCAPLWAMITHGGIAASSGEEKITLAEGVRVNNPLRGAEVLRAIQESQGSIFITAENEIIPGRNSLARLGLYVEPTSAIVWPALGKLIEGLIDPVVVVLTGSGYKFN
jgi:threonine synthase